MSKALEKTYDGIIIGAGHHGLILGSYLAKAGLRILLVDRRLQYGGGLTTKEVTVPGFYHNLHSINHFHISETPWFKDLGLEDRVTYITPRYEFGQAHSDGTALVFGRDREETIANVARFSKRDAETFRDWNRRAEEITARILMPERYAEPLSQAERETLLAKTAIGRDFLTISRRQPLDVVQELFENDHVKLLFLFKVSLFGTWLTDTLSKTSPMGSVIRAFDLDTGYQLCQGGSFNLARGLMETFIAAGGTFAPQVAIDRILIEGGRAGGIVLADGRTVRAKSFVASTIDVHQTFENLIGRTQLPAAFLDKLDGFQYTNWTLFGLHLALHESPRFAAASFDPNIDRTLKWSIGAETMEDLFSAHEDVKAGRVPRIVQFGSGPLSLLDPTQAPPGKHTTYCWHVMPFEPELNGQDYEDFKREFAEKIIDTFARYCPNLTRNNIIGQYVYTAKEYTAEMINMRQRRYFHGRVQRRAGDVQPFRLSHADTKSLHGRIRRTSRRRDFRRRRVYYRRHHRPRSRPQAVVATGRCRRGARRAGGSGLIIRRHCEVSMSDTFSVTDKVVVITGAGQGLGRAFAKTFASGGAKVVIAERNVEKARDVEREIAAGNGHAIVVETDVADEGSVARMAERVGQTFGRADVLINNAAIFSTLEMRPFEQIPLAEWEQVLRVNITGPFLCSRALVPLMRKNKWGRIINMASGAVTMGRPNYLHYIASKAALAGMSHSMARELGGDGITVNAILPGATFTEIPRQTVTPEQKQRIVAMQSIARPQVPEDLLGVVLFLASDASAFMTGQELTVDGGATHP